LKQDERTLDETILKSWIGKTQQVHDLIDAGQACRMQSTMDRDPTLRDGDDLPPLWHWVYFLEASRLGILGRDGHPKLGGFIPPVDLPRRMWAGGRFEFNIPIQLGEQIIKTSTIKDVILKQGRTGMLCFVTVRHELTGEDGSLRLSEEHDIVYREDSKPGQNVPSPVAPPGEALWSRTVEPTPVMLFRFSALTFNGHRIHYDREYSREVEGYDGLVFHGPLTATLLADLAVEKRSGSQLIAFSFRGLSPLFDTAPFTIHGKETENDSDVLELWASAPDGSLAMTATASFNR